MNLEELRSEQSARLEVIFVDAWKDPKAADAHGVKMIPTQIFFDRSGRELYRHQGFFSKGAILTTWASLGYDLGTVAAKAEGQR